MGKLRNYYDFHLLTRCGKLKITHRFYSLVAKRLPSKQEIPGSIPGGTFLFFFFRVAADLALNT